MILLKATLLIRVWEDRVVQYQDFQSDDIPRDVYLLLEGFHVGVRIRIPASLCTKSVG